LLLSFSPLALCLWRSFEPGSDQHAALTVHRMPPFGVTHAGCPAPLGGAGLADTADPPDTTDDPVKIAPVPMV
jgi:hypothetical protein